MRKADKSFERLETDLLTLRSFVAVVEEGGFSAAAKRVHRTQSAISLQMAKLEERLNVQLLERTSRSVSLTSAGETFLSYARRILELADEASLAVSAPDEKALLRVGFPNYLAPVHLSDTLGRFRRAHPNCDLSLVLGMSSEMLEALDRGELDLVIANPEGAKGRLLWEDKLVWIGKESLCVEEEEEVDLVLMPSPCSYRALAFDLLTKVGRAWKMSIEANSVEAVCSAVDAGLGVSVLPFSAVADRETIIEGILPELPNTSVMSFSNPDSPNPYLERFLEILLDSIES